MHDRLEYFDSIILPMQGDMWANLPLPERIKTIEKTAVFYEHFHDKMGVIDASLPAFVMFHGFMERMKMDENIRKNDVFWQAAIEDFHKMDPLQKSMYIQEVVGLFKAAETIQMAEMLHLAPPEGLVKYLENIQHFSRTILESIYFEG